MEANKLTHLPKRHRSQRCDSFTGYICSIPSYLPSFSVWCVCVCVCVCRVCVCVCVCVPCVCQSLDCGWEGPCIQAFVPILSGFEHGTHGASGIQDLSSRWGNPT